MEIGIVIGIMIGGVGIVIDTETEEIGTEVVQEGGLGRKERKEAKRVNGGEKGTAENQARERARRGREKREKWKKERRLLPKVRKQKLHLSCN